MCLLVLRTCGYSNSSIHITQYKFTLSSCISLSYSTIIRVERLNQSQTTEYASRRTHDTTDAEHCHSTPGNTAVN